MKTLLFNVLIRRVSHDSEAFNEIYEEYFPLVVMHIRRKFGGQEIDAEDIAQETFIRILGAEVKGTIESPVAWLYAISDRIVFNILRDAVATEELAEDICVDSFLDNFFEEDEISQKLDKLEKDSNKIIYLHFCEGYNFKQISMLLNMNYNTVRQKYSRAKIFLRNVLSQKE